MKNASTARTLVASAFFLVLAACASGQSETTDEPACSSHSLAVQVLGSGGPIADDHRAASSNIVWIDGKARLLIDAGAGMFTRYGEAKIDFRDHEAILLTHLHGDHAAGLPSLLNHGSFSGRTADLTVIGPDGSELFPSTTQFIESLIGKEIGALRYLHPYLNDEAALPRLQITDLDTGQSGAQPVLNSGDVSIDAIPVHHLDVPSLSFVVKAQGKTIVFAGDQSFLSENFVTTLKDSQPDLLVMHNAITMADGQPRGLHRDPSSIGQTASALGAKALLLTHHMQRALQVQNEVNDAIAAKYAGPVLMADDLSCFRL